MDKMGLMGLLKNFTGNVCNLSHPFIQDDKIISTNGHLMIIIDKTVAPDTYRLINDLKLSVELPDALGALADFTRYGIRKPFKQSCIDKLKIKHNYPYHIFSRNWLQKERASSPFDCGEDCPISTEKKILFDEGFYVNFAYLMLLEAIMLYFGGNWTVWFPESKREQIIFTSGKVIFSLMPMGCK